MALKRKPIPEHVKDALIEEHPDGLRIVLEDEYPSDMTTAGDLVGINFDEPDQMLLHLRPASDGVQ
jgi:hypothetical protein